MKADLRDVAGIVAAEKVDEVVLVPMNLDGVFLSEAPFAIAAVSFPIGDVALSDVDVEFREGVDDVFLLNMIEEHAVDDVAHGFVQASDLAVARLFWRKRARHA